MGKQNIDGDQKESAGRLASGIDTDDGSSQQNNEEPGPSGHFQDLTGNALESDFYGVDSMPRMTVAEEGRLWGKYIRWRYIRRFPELSIALRDSGNAASATLCNCNLEGVLRRIVQEISRSHDLVVLVRHHLQLDELGDTIIEGGADGANPAIELLRLMQRSKEEQGDRGRRESTESCCLKDLFGFMLGEALNNIAFGKGNPGLISRIVNASDAAQNVIEDRLYGLAINRELLPKDLLSFVDPQTPLYELPQILQSVPSESSSRFISEHYQPFVLDIKAEGEKALARLIESHLWLARNIARRHCTDNGEDSLDDFVQEGSPAFIDGTEAADSDSPLGQFSQIPSVCLIEAIERKELSLPLDDLIQEGAVGLVIAAQKFQPSRGNRYMSYAGYWVYQRIRRAIQDQACIVRFPAHMIERFCNLMSAMRELAQELWREPSYEELGRRLHLSPEQIEQILMSVSLCSFVGDPAESPLRDFLEDETFVAPFDSASNKLLREQIDRLLNQLTESQKKVLQLRFGLEDGHSLTLEEVGKELNLTRERIRQIEGKALERLRHPSRSRWLKGYLE